MITLKIRYNKFVNKYDSSSMYCEPGEYLKINQSFPIEHWTADQKFINKLKELEKCPKLAIFHFADGGCSSRWWKILMTDLLSNKVKLEIKEI